MDELRERFQEINGLTNYDYFMTKSTFEIMHNKKFQCGSCVKKNAPAVREKRMNCTGKSGKVVSEGGFNYSRCPGNFYHPGYAQLVDVHRNFRNGVLGFPGGLLNQPAKYIDAMNLIENLTIDKELSRIEKTKPNGTRKVRSGRQ